TFDGPARAQKFEQVQAFYQTHPGDYRVFGTGSDAALEGGRDLWDQEPLILSRYALFVSQSQGFPEEAIFRTSPIFTRFQPIYALTRLRYILNVDGAGRLKAMELPFKPFPQVKIYHQYVTVASASDAVGRLLSPGFDFKHRLILEQKPNPAPSKPTALESVSVQNRSVDRLDLEANLSAPGILLITDNYGLGWKAKDLNGTSASSFKVMPADGFLRAIALPAGQHRLALVYAPDSFRVGLWISLVALMFSIVILTCVFRRPLFPPIQRK
ncbi:MAG: hypothetical protein ACREL1_02615, partial [bacterium]